MCVFILVTLPKVADITRLTPIFDAYNHELLPLVNTCLGQQIPGSDFLYSTTRGHCDCGTGLGSFVYADGEMNSKRERYRRKGWSEQKITRALAESHQAAMRMHVTRRDQAMPDIIHWHGLLTKTLQQKSITHVGVLLHMYEGCLDAEYFTIIRTERIQLSESTPEQLGYLEHDILYLISA